MAQPRQIPTLLRIPGFGRGCGADSYFPGFYGLGLNADCRFGFFMPGPREVADATGIAAGYRIIKMVRHADVPALATTNGTDTKIYRLEAAVWAEKATILARVATDAVSFNSIYAVAFGSANPYQFTTATGGGAWAFTASTKTAANSDSANYFAVQSNGIITARVVYVTNPNDLYLTEDLTNGDGTGVTATYLGTNNSSDNFVTSVTEDVTGRILVGTRRALWSLSADMTKPERLTPDYPDPPTDAGGQSDRNNFEAYAKVKDRIYYVVGGYHLFEYRPGPVWNDKMAPRDQARGNIPRMDLPINAILAVGDWIILALGSKNTSTLKDVAHAPGGSSRISNSFTTASELYIGGYMPDPEDDQVRFTWHGVALTATDPLRYMWFDEDTDYVYLASGDSELVDAQQRRFYFVKDNPLYHLVSSAINRATGTAQLEILGIDVGEPFYPKLLKHIDLRTQGLADATPSMEIEYKTTGDYDTAAFESSFVTFTANADALVGRDFPRNSVFKTMDLRFLGVGNATTNTYAILRDAELSFDQLPEHKTVRPIR